MDVSCIVSEILQGTRKWQSGLKWPLNVLQAVVYDFLLVVYSNLCRVTHGLREIWFDVKQRNGLEISPRPIRCISLMTIQQQSCHLKAVVWFLISSFSFYGHIVYTFRDIGHGNNNIDWNDLQMSFKVIEHGTSRQPVYELPLVVYILTLAIPRTCRFRDTSCFNAENHFCRPTCIWPWIWRSWRWNVETKFGARKRESWASLRWLRLRYAYSIALRDEMKW